MTLHDLYASSIRSRWDGRKPLPPWHQGPCHRLLLHAGGHHHARHYPGVCAGCKWDARKCTDLNLRGGGAVLHIVYCGSYLQKINRKKHFSKTKHSKFNESGQLSAFYLFSFGWGASILLSVRTVNKLLFFLFTYVLRPKTAHNANAKCFSFFSPPSGKLPVKSSQPMGRLSPHTDAVSCNDVCEDHVILFFVV